MSNDAARVRGVFHDTSGLNRAINELGRRSIPSDTVHVYLVDEDNRPAREIPVERDRGALRGAIRGAVAGALFGVFVAAFAPGRFEIRPIPFGYDSWLAGGLIVVLGALTGLAFGIALGMGHWLLRTREREETMARGAGWVEVEGAELAAASRRALQAAGADRISKRS